MSGDSLELREMRDVLKRGADKSGAEPASQSREVGRPSGAHGEKYQRILDSAVEVIAERGYFNSPVSAIAARAGVVVSRCLPPVGCSGVTLKLRDCSFSFRLPKRGHR